MKTEIQHFTNAPEIQHFAVEKVNKNDNAYGVGWGNVVREYLKTAYSDENAQAEIVSFGTTYKVLKRENVTAFYDMDGNTLFDVENARLEKEYAWVMKEEAEQKSEELEEDRDPREDIEETADDVQTEDVVPMGTASLAEALSGLPAPTTEEIEAAQAENAKTAKQRAKEKLEKELENAKEKEFADVIIAYLLKRCEEDEGLSLDIVQEHKTWKKCLDYIYAQAKKQSKGNCAAIRDDVVYEWAEDYYHKDDKAEEERKAKKEAEAKAKREKAAAERKTQEKEKPSSVAVSVIPKKEGKRKDQGKKNSRDMEGQLDMFSMMGM